LSAAEKTLGRANDCTDQPGAARVARGCEEERSCGEGEDGGLAAAVLAGGLGVEDPGEDERIALRL
jgi:hypothetical protein